MSKVARWISEAVRRLRGPQGSLLPAWTRAYGEVAPVSFEDLVAVYDAFPRVQTAVEYWTMAIVGPGVYTSCASEEDYGDANHAKDVVDHFNKKVDLDSILLDWVRRLCAYGNLFLELVTPDNPQTLSMIPLVSIEKIIRDPNGTVTGYKQTSAYGGKTLSPESIDHWAWNVKEGNPFGTGLIEPLCRKYRLSDGDTRTSIIDGIARFQAVMPDIFEKYAGPNELWVFEQASDDQIAIYSSTIRNMPKKGARFVYNKPAEVKAVQLDPRTQFQAYVEYYDDEFTLALQIPLLRLFLKPGYTEASANVALEIWQGKIMAKQRFIKRQIEKIWDLVVDQAGYDPLKAEVRLNWNPLKPPTPEMVDLLKAAELGVIRADEFRKNALKFGWELWEVEAEQTQPV